MLFSIIIFVVLILIYDLLRDFNKNSKKQIELLENLKVQNGEMIKLLDKKENK